MYSSPQSLLIAFNLIEQIGKNTFRFSSNLSVKISLISGNNLMFPFLLSLKIFRILILMFGNV